MDNTIIIHNAHKTVKSGNFVVNQRCPKCGGNLFLDRDFYGVMEECLQCGFTRNLDKEVK